VRDVEDVDFDDALLGGSLHRLAQLREDFVCLSLGFGD
jgi:hypothetical protein